MIKEQLEEIVNLDEVILELVQKTQSLPNLTLEAMRLHNLLSLPYLPTRCIRGKETLDDYFQSHVVISIKYLNILRKKTMDKVVSEEIREGKKRIRR